jgi:hypothetical protein
MDLKVQFINAIRNELSGESSIVLERNIRKRSIVSEDIYTGVRFQFKPLFHETSVPYGNYSSKHSPMHKASYSRSYFSKILLTIIVIAAIGLPFYFGGKFLSNTFDLNLFVSILIELAALLSTALIIFLVIKLVKYIYSIFDNKINSIQPESVEVKDVYDDDIYCVISNTYETLCNFRKERERQAKNSFNVALTLVIVGVLIVFGGVFLLFKKNIVEGVLSSTVGSISSIIGGTIIKLYKDTNDRMDKLDANLSTLNYAKVQYALILKINDEKKRDVELSMLIKSIGKISK